MENNTKGNVKPEFNIHEQIAILNGMAVLELETNNDIIFYGKLITKLELETKPQDLELARLIMTEKLKLIKYIKSIKQKIALMMV